MNIAAFAGGVLSKVIGVPGPGGQPWRPGVDLFGFNIRPAASGDFKRLAKLFDELDEFHRRGRPDLFVKPQGPAREPGEIEALIAGPDSTILVAEGFGVSAFDRARHGVHPRDAGPAVSTRPPDRRGPKSWRSPACPPPRRRAGAYARGHAIRRCARRRRHGTQRP